jgi:hypothetical protein
LIKSRRTKRAADFLGVCGIFEHFSLDCPSRTGWLRVYTAPKPYPRLVVELVVEPVETLLRHAHTQATQTVGQPNAKSYFRRDKK